MRFAPRVTIIGTAIAVWSALALPAAVDGQLDSSRRTRSAARSNVGYVDNAIVGTQLQLRYDNAMGADAPDRAEFIYAKCGCFGGDATGPIGGSPPRVIEYDLSYQDITLDGEFAFHERFSAFAELPFRLARGEVLSNAEGIGDIMAGFKLALVATEDRYLTLQLRSYLPTGKAEDGLGTDHLSLEPGILFHEGSGDRFKAEAELRLWIPVDGASNENTGITTSDNYYGNVLRYGVGLGYDVSPEAQVRFTPVVELVGWRILSGIGAWSPDGTPTNLVVEDAGGTNIFNLKVGGRFGIRESDAIYVGWGTALTDEHWYDNILRVEYRLVR